MHISRNVNLTSISSPSAPKISEQAKIWLMAARPKTLGATIAPVVMGGALAFSHKAFHLPSFLAALFAGLWIQIATNLINDYCDFEKGADTQGRIGPPRVMQAGLVTSLQMKKAIAISLSIASALGVYLVFRAGIVILGIGLLSIACSVLYTAGPISLAYLGLGEIFVLIFFGPIALAGTYYVQSLQWSQDAMILGLAPGLLSTALITVNNLRDKTQDVQAGKRTLAVRFGGTTARALFSICLLGAAVIPAWLIWRGDLPMGVMLVCGVTFIFALKRIDTVYEVKDPIELNDVLASVGKFLFVYAFLFCIGMFI